MAITVKLTDATVKVEGDFQAVLAFVKSLPGRAYDGATKTNIVQMSLAQFSPACNFPFSTAGGKAATPKVDDFTQRYAAVKAELVSRAEAMGIDVRIVRHIERFDIDDQIEAGRIRFSSPERLRMVEELDAWFVKSMAVVDAAKEEAEAQTWRRRNEERGIF